VFNSVFAQRFADKGKEVRALTVRRTGRRTVPSQRRSLT
jgi:hypothetical protein